MLETLVSIKIPPGVYRNGTLYQASRRWVDSHLVRWVDGTIRPVGGWRVSQDTNAADLPPLTGAARAALAWRAADGGAMVGVGTHNKLYVLIEGALSDITPTGLTVGLVDSELSSGSYGSGVYGAGPYGSGALTLALTPAGTWQLDTFGEWLAGVLSSDGKLYVWQADPVTPAAQAAGSPVGNRGVVVTPERFVVVLGAGGNARLVQWPSQEGVTDWTPTDINTAGEIELQTNGAIVCGRRTSSNTLIWTDVDLHELNYIGGELVYAPRRAGDNCGIIAPGAVAIVEGRVLWMGRSDFHAYDGYVTAVPCDVKDRVFGDFNFVQAVKVVATPIGSFGEVWWFYPSAGSTDNDRYVVYNYREKHWTVGYIGRTAAFDIGAAPTPMMLTLDHAAKGTLTSTGVNVANNDTVTIDGKVYTFQSILTNVDGHVFIGANAAASLVNLSHAINLSSGSGSLYAASTTVHTTVKTEEVTATTIVVRAKAAGVGGNAIATTELSTVLSWGAVTLVNGGDATGYPVATIYEHEVGLAHGDEVPYIESGAFEIGNGDQVARVQRIIPDEQTQGDVQLTFFASMFPNDTETTYGPYSLTSPTDVRFTARQARLKLIEQEATDWRVGDFRLGVIPGGRR